MDDAPSTATPTYRLAPEQIEELRKALSGNRGRDFKEWLQLSVTTLIAAIGLYATVTYNLFQANLSRRRVVDKYLEYLAKGAPGPRVAALGSLMELNHSYEAAEWLVFSPPATDDGDQATRPSELDLFLSSRGAPLLPSLLQIAGRANNPEHAIRYIGRIALYGEGFDQLIQVIKDRRQSVETRTAALYGLQSGSFEFNEPQRTQLYDLLYELSQLGSIHIASSIPTEIRARAVGFLAYLCRLTSSPKHPKLREELVGILNDSNAPDEVRIEAIPVADENTLIELLKDRNERPALRWKIVETHQIPLEILGDMLASGDELEVEIGLRGIPSDKSSIDTLLSAYPQKALSHNPRAWIIMHLKCCVDDPRVLAFYRRQLKVEADPTLRIYAYGTLASARKPETLALLKMAASDPDPHVRQVVGKLEQDQKSGQPSPITRTLPYRSEH
jgi:hypothetical protein